MKKVLSCKKVGWMAFAKREVEQRGPSWFHFFFRSIIRLADIFLFFVIMSSSFWWRFEHYHKTDGSVTEEKSLIKKKKLGASKKSKTLSFLSLLHSLASLAGSRSGKKREQEGAGDERKQRLIRWLRSSQARRKKK